MLLWILGGLDIFIGILFLLAWIGIEGPFIIWVGLLILIKSLLFFDGVAAVLDIFGAILLFWISLVSLNIYPFLAGIMALWFLQKGFFSFVS